MNGMDVSPWKKKAYLGIAFGAVLVCIAAAYIYMYAHRDSSGSDFATVPNVETEWGNPSVAAQEAQRLSAELPTASSHYVDPKLKLSFDYPKGFTVSAFDEDEGDDGEDAGQRTILTQDAQKSIGLQITAMPFADPINTLTEDRIEGDLDIRISKYSIIKIGKDNDIEAVTFLSGDSVLYREVWFVNNGMLYEAKAYQSSEPLIIAILRTLKLD
jgi:hypothetical protein